MKIIKPLTVLFLFALFLLPKDVLASTNIYRLYQPSIKKHLYSPSPSERDKLWYHADWIYEGIAWVSPDAGQGVYRLYHPGIKTHLYTKDTNEVRVLTQRHGWKADNGGRPTFYSGGSIPIYRLYNPRLKVHHITTDANEYRVLAARGWNQEGIAFYALEKGQNDSSVPTGWQIAYIDLGFDKTEMVYYKVFENESRIIIDKINQHRARHGRRGLPRYDSRATTMRAIESAYWFAKHRKLSHDRPNGNPYYTVKSTAHYRLGGRELGGENLSAYANGAFAFYQWEHSPGHNSNMLSEAWFAHAHDAKSVRVRLKDGREGETSIHLTYQRQ